MGIFDKIKQKTSSAGHGFQQKMADRNAAWKQKREAQRQAGWREEYKERFGPQRLPESERKPSIRERLNVGDRLAQHRTQRAYDKWAYNQAYKEEKHKSQEQKMRSQARSSAYRDVFGGRQLGTSLSIYGTATRRTYNKARTSGVLDALISGDAGHHGRFEARRNVPQAAFYSDKNNIFGTRGRKRTSRGARNKRGYTSWTP